MKNIPILFLGGAAKSGTTFLYNLLLQHPTISESTPKETYFFMDSDHLLLHKKKNIHTSPEKLFYDYFHITPKTELLLEATPHLLYQQQIETLFKSFEQSKFIFLLREPADRIRSSFEYTKYNQANFLNDISFLEYAEALLKKDTKLIASWLKDTSQYVLPKELYISTYYLHVQKWLEAFGSERVKFIQFEVLMNQAEAIVLPLLDWLHLDKSHFETSADQKNSTYHFKHPKMHAFLNQIVQTLPEFPLRKKLKQLYYKNVKITTQKDESIAEGLKLLSSYFYQPNQKLAQLIDIDLEKWGK